MRFVEFQNNTNEGRLWTADDETKLLSQQMDKQDNERAVNAYFQDVQLTNAVNVLASRSDCKWFFDLLTTKLHKLEAEGVEGVEFHLYRFEDEWLIWAVDANEFPHIYEYKKDASFPYSAIALNAVNESGTWHVSLRDVVE